MDNTGEQSALMAETLIVLAGENAWSAARGFARFSVHRRDVAQARYWRSVAGGVLRRYAEKLASSAHASTERLAAPAAPEAAPETQVSAAALAASDALAEMREVVAAAPAEPAVATGNSNSAAGWKNVGRAPIPLRARRTSSLHAMAPEDAPAKAVVERNAAEENLLARAA